VTRAVLVVEDEPLVRALAADVLEGAGFLVIEASSADYAMVVLDKRSDVAVVFTDVEMPGHHNGLELARFVHDHYPGITVVVASGRVRPARGEMPPDALFVTKPYAPHALLQAVRKAVPQDALAADAVSDMASDGAGP
jgi:DNA-binding NtrC family response regulator